MKKIFFAFIMASSALLCAQSYEHTSPMLDPFFGVKEDNQESSVLHIKDLETSCGSCSSHHNHNQHNKGVFGSFYTTSDAEFFDIIPLTNTSFARGVSLNPDGTIALNKKGSYLVNFGVSGSSAGTATVELKLNELLLPSSAISIESSALTSASTIINVPKSSLPATLALVNISTFDRFPTNIVLTPNGGISAFISIERIGD